MRVLIYFAVSGIVLSSVTLYVASASDSSDKMMVSFLDVGQGDSILIETPNGIRMLVDGGPNDAVLRELGEALPWFVRHIDVVMLTHPDLDHVGGLIDVLGRYTIERVIGSVASSSAPTFRAFDMAVREEGVTLDIVDADDSIVLDPIAGISLDVLYPVSDPTQLETNDQSIVAMLRYGSTSVLLTGDASMEIEKLLLERGYRIDADVLKVGHHGSNTSSAPEFLAAVSPQFAVISAGEGNRYGHPTERVLSDLAAASTTILQTKEKDTIVFVSDGQSIELVPDR